MNFELGESIRRGFGVVLRAFLFSAAIGSAQAQSQNCNNLYGAIKAASMYCGFFCDQNELRPLQAAYEAKCIVSVIPASALGFDSSPEPSVPSATSTEPQPQSRSAAQISLSQEGWLVR